MTTASPSTIPIPDHPEFARNDFEPLGELEFGPEALRRTGDHFTDFFGEIREHMIEREDLLTQQELALLAGEHLVQIGPAGTGKSVSSRMILDRIVDPTADASLFDLQLHLESRRSHVVGPSLPVTDPETGKMELITQFTKGLAPCDYALLDEIFDAPAGVLRGALLTALVDRKVNEGDVVEDLKLRSAFAASNETMDGLRKKYGEQLDAMFDRFAFLYYTIKRPLREGSSEAIIRMKGERDVAKEQGSPDPHGLEVQPLQLVEMDLLQKAVEKARHQMVNDGWSLELASKLYYTFRRRVDDISEEFAGKGPSKMESSRTQNLMVRLLPAIAIRRHIMQPDTPPSVIPEDFELLKLFFMMRGPLIGDLPGSIEDIASPKDRFVLGRLRQEDQAFNEAYGDTVMPRRRQLREDEPASLDDDLAAVEQWEGQVEAGITDDATIKRGCQTMKSKVDQIARYYTRVPQAEELFARALGTYISLLTLAVQVQEDVAAGACRMFRAIQPRLEGMGSSFHAKRFEGPVAEFKTALRGAYEDGAKATGATLENLFATLDRVTKAAEVLEEEAIESLRTMIKTAALDRIPTTVSVDDVQQGYDELQKLMNLRSILASEGVSGKIPLANLMDIQSRMLELINGMIEKAGELMAGGGLDEPKRNEMLGLINTALEYYKQAGVVENKIGAPTNEQVPEEMVEAHIAAEKKSKTGKGKKVEGAQVPCEESAQIAIEWKVGTMKKPQIDRQSMQDDYRKYCEGQVMAQDDALLAIPTVAETISRMKLMGDVVFAEEWSPQLEALLQDAYLRTVRGVHKAEMDGDFVWPVQPRSMAISSWPIKHDKVAKGVEAAVDQACQDAGNIAAFLEGEKSIQPTEANVATFSKFLSEQGKATGKERVSVQTIETTVEQVPVATILENAAEPNRTAWADLHEAIEASNQDLGGKVADLLIQGRLSALSAASATTTADQFTQKYGRFFGAEDGEAEATIWEHIPVDLSHSPQVSKTLEADVTEIIGALAVRKDAGLMDSVGTPLVTVIEFLEKTSGISNGPALVDRLKEAGKVKAGEWKDARRTHLKTRGNEITGVDDVDAPKHRIERMQEKTGEIMSGMAAEAEQCAQALAKAGEHFDIDEDEQKAMTAEVIDGMAESLLISAQGIIDTVNSVEMPDNGFKMSDLSTLNGRNQKEVDEFMSSNKILSTAQEAIDAIQVHLGSPDVEEIIGDNPGKQAAQTKVAMGKLASDFREAWVKVRF